MQNVKIGTYPMRDPLFFFLSSQTPLLYTMPVPEKPQSSRVHQSLLQSNKDRGFRKRSLTMTTDTASRMRASRNTDDQEKQTARSRFSAIMIRRPSRSTSTKSSTSTTTAAAKDEKQQQQQQLSKLSRRQSITRATASSLAKVVPNFQSKKDDGRRNSIMTLSNSSNGLLVQPQTPKPTVAKSSTKGNKEKKIFFGCV